MEMLQHFTTDTLAHKICIFKNIFYQNILMGIQLLLIYYTSNIHKDEMYIFTNPNSCQ